MKITAIIMIMIKTKTPPPAAAPVIATILSGLGSGFSFPKTWKNSLMLQTAEFCWQNNLTGRIQFYRERPFYGCKSI